AVALARATIAAGGIALNYARCTAVSTAAGGELLEAEVCDVLTGKAQTVCARVLLNCTGAGADAIRRLVRPGAAPRIRPSKGAHIVVKSEAAPLCAGVLVPRTADGRTLFALPW